ncbi:MAG: aminoglycoside phosphotransferase family protein [Cyanobacteriota bacterium]|nr:aminoglycoside phosphotransferase family protein [Cyanobacteriota bacterium]
MSMLRQSEAMHVQDLAALASRFSLDGSVVSIEPLGMGNVNATFRVSTCQGTAYVLQRLNTGVFINPEHVMANLWRVSRHVMPRLQGQQADQRPAWQWCAPVPLQCHDECLASAAGRDGLLLVDGEAWRMLTHIDGAKSLNVLETCAQANEIGRALGRFHALVHDLPADQLFDTLVGFHVTPLYYAHFCELLQSRPPDDQDSKVRWCLDFIRNRVDLVPVLERALSDGRLKLQPIHGDPKVNNIMLCNESGCAVAMVDLDTVKPGLLHTDIADALRSGCNLAGEETTDLDRVCFDLGMAEAMLLGYMSEARFLLGQSAIEYLYDAIRLLPFELGLRFFSDHLAGNVYFKVRQPGHNLSRALVQFSLAASIELQEVALRALIARLTEA